LATCQSKLLNLVVNHRGLSGYDHVCQTVIKLSRDYYLLFGFLMTKQKRSYLTLVAFVHMHYEQPAHDVARITSNQHTTNHAIPVTTFPR